jgi:hypothetical protein
MKGGVGGGAEASWIAAEPQDGRYRAAGSRTAADTARPDLGSPPLAVNRSSTTTPRRAVRACVFVATTAVMCAALLSAAVLVPAPPAALPMILAVCIGLPMAVAFELPTAFGVVRGAVAGRRHLSALRRELERLPETRHPLDL